MTEWREFGNITRQKAPKRLQPSIQAASSSTQHGGQVIRPHGVDQRYGQGFPGKQPDQTADAEKVKFDQTGVGRDQDQLGRDDDRKQQAGKQHLFSRETEAGKAVACQTAATHLQKGADDGHPRGGQKDPAEIQLVEHIPEMREGDGSGNPDNGRIVHLVCFPHRYAQHDEQRIQKHDGEAEQEDPAGNAAEPFPENGQLLFAFVRQSKRTVGHLSHSSLMYRLPGTAC